MTDVFGLDMFICSVYLAYLVLANPGNILKMFSLLLPAIGISHGLVIGFCVAWVLLVVLVFGLELVLV